MFDKNDKQTRQLADAVLGYRVRNEDDPAEVMVRMVYESPVAISVNDMVSYLINKEGKKIGYPNPPIYMEFGHVAFSLKQKGIFHLVEDQPVKWLITQEMIDFCNEKRDRGSGHRTFVGAQFQSLEDVDFAGQVNSDLPSMVSTIEVAIIRYLLRAKEASVPQLAADINSDCRWLAGYQRYKVALDGMVNKGYISRLHAKHDPYYLINPVFEKFIELQKEKSKMSNNKSEQDNDGYSADEIVQAFVAGDYDKRDLKFIIPALMLGSEGHQTNRFEIELHVYGRQMDAERGEQIENVIRNLRKADVLYVSSYPGVATYRLSEPFLDKIRQEQVEQSKRKSKPGSIRPETDDSRAEVELNTTLAKAVVFGPGSMTGHTYGEYYVVSNINPYIAINMSALQGVFRQSTEEKGDFNEIIKTLVSRRVVDLLDNNTQVKMTDYFIGMVQAYCAVWRETRTGDTKTRVSTETTVQKETKMENQTKPKFDARSSENDLLAKETFGQLGGKKSRLAEFLIYVFAHPTGVSLAEVHKHFVDAGLWYPQLNVGELSLELEKRGFVESMQVGIHFMVRLTRHAKIFLEPYYAIYKESANQDNVEKPGSFSYGVLSKNVELMRSVVTGPKVMSGMAFHEYRLVKLIDPDKTISLQDLYAKFDPKVENWDLFTDIVSNLKQRRVIEAHNGDNSWLTWTEYFTGMVHSLEMMEKVRQMAKVEPAKEPRPLKMSSALALTNTILEGHQDSNTVEEHIVRILHALEKPVDAEMLVTILRGAVWPTGSLDLNEFNSDIASLLQEGIIDREHVGADIFSYALTPAMRSYIDESRHDMIVATSSVKESSNELDPNKTENLILGTITPEMVEVYSSGDSTNGFVPDPAVMKLTVEVMGKQMSLDDVRYLYRNLVAFVDPVNHQWPLCRATMNLFEVEYDLEKAKKMLEHIEHFGVAAFDPKS